MKRLVVAANVAVLAIAAPSAAAPPVSTAVEVSRLVLPRANWDQMMKGLTEQTRQQIESMVAQSGGQLPPGFAQTFAKEYEAMLSWEEMLDLQAGLLAKYYTEAELRQLLAFYRTPLGAKAIRIMPEITQDVGGQMFALLQQRLPAMMERLAPLLEQAKPPR